MWQTEKKESKAKKWRRRIAHEFVHIHLALLGLSILGLIGISGLAKANPPPDRQQSRGC